MNIKRVRFNGDTKHCLLVVERDDGIKELVPADPKDLEVLTDGRTVVYKGPIPLRDRLHQSHRTLDSAFTAAVVLGSKYRGV